ncbi:MAG: DUF4129 domain-containing protein [Pseudomonadota bacterium]
MTRLAALGAALAGLLAVVAAAATVDGAGGTHAARGGVPPAVAAYGYGALVLVALVGLPVLALLAIREVPEARQRTRRVWLAPIAIAALAAAGVAVSVYGGDGFSDVLARIRIVEPSTGDADAARPPSTGWAPLLVLVGVAAGGGALVLRRRPSARTSLSDRVAGALGAPLDDLRSEPDVRRAIVAAFRRLEVVLEAAGAPRSVGEAPLEYVDRVLADLDVPPEPTAALAALFEQAKFSLHPLGERERDAAIDALEAVREALR